MIQYLLVLQNEFGSKSFSKVIVLAIRNKENSKNSTVTSSKDYSEKQDRGIYDYSNSVYHLKWLRD